MEKRTRKNKKLEAGLLLMTDTRILQKIMVNCIRIEALLVFGHFTARENEGTEREAPGPALGICHVHESYF